MPNLFDFLNSINTNKVDLIKQDPHNVKDYVPFIINKGLSYFPDTIILSNEMNKHPDIPKALQYKFLLNTVRSKKRFSKWFKPEKQEGLDAVQQYYGCNQTRAKEYFDLLTPAQVAVIMEEMDTGGVHKKPKKHDD